MKVINLLQSPLPTPEEEQSAIWIRHDNQGLFPLSKEAAEHLVRSIIERSGPQFCSRIGFSTVISVQPHDRVPMTSLELTAIMNRFGLKPHGLGVILGLNSKRPGDTVKTWLRPGKPDVPGPVALCMKFLDKHGMIDSEGD